MATSNNNTRAAKSGGVPDGYRRVQIAYSSTDPALVGTVVDLPEGEARIKVDQGRARYVADGTKLGKQDAKPAPAESSPTAVEPASAPAGA